MYTEMVRFHISYDEWLGKLEEYAAEKGIVIDTGDAQWLDLYDADMNVRDVIEHVFGG